MLRQRLVFGALMVLAIVGLFWLDERAARMELPDAWRPIIGDRPTLPPGLLLLGAAAVLIPLAAGELAAMCRAKKIDASPWVMSIGAAAVALTVYVTAAGGGVSGGGGGSGGSGGAAILCGVTIAALVLGLIRHGRGRRVEGALAAAGATLLGVTYLGFLGGLILALRWDHSAWLVLAMLLVIKSADIGAYGVGTLLGRHKLIPWLSPGKTWEGLFGGIVLAAAVAAALAAAGPAIIGTAAGSYHPAWAAAGGAVLAVAGHAGDLTISLFKRDAGLKDSGHLVPGSGGVLDVLDSPLLAAPVAYWMLTAGG